MQDRDHMQEVIARLTVIHTVSGKALDHARQWAEDEVRLARARAEDRVDPLSERQADTRYGSAPGSSRNTAIKA